jgi:5'(3')-deoxyribonucleotidase
MTKKRLFFDMDGVLVDFQSGISKLSEDTRREYEGRLDEVPGIFSLMDPMPGAIEAVHRLQEYYDVYILSTAPWKNPIAASDKVAWVTKYLDDVFHKRMVITHCKNLCKGDYLIDDRGKNGTSEFEGEWIHFGSERFPDWESVLNYLLASERCTKNQNT